MKTELVLGKKVVRVDEVDGPCRAIFEDKGIDCAFIDVPCHTKGQYACDIKPVIFIRPDQIVDYLALKLVS